MKLYGKTKKEAADAFRKGNVTVAVYGLGKMGLPLAAVFADCGANVIGVDISQQVVSGINKGINHIKEEPGLSELVEKNVRAGRLKATLDQADAAKKADVMVILVPTLIKDNKPVLSPVHSAAENIAKGLKKGDIVITECTMPPGSTEALIPILEKGGLSAGRDFGLGHCPERTMTGTALEDIRGKYPKIVGAVDGKSLDPLIGIYSAINKKGVIPVSGIKAAELVKVFEGVYRDVNIGLANELSIVCEKNGADYMEIQSAANTQPFSHLHKPGGVGGHCIPYYPYFIMDDDTILIKTARDVNERIPERIVKMAASALGESKRALKDSNVLVMGIAFRGGVKETIKSTALEVVEKIKPISAKVYAYDPLYSDQETARLGVEYHDEFKDIDCIIIMADHEEFKSLDWERVSKEVRTKALVDTRQLLEPAEYRKHGFVYRGIGYV